MSDITKEFQKISLSVHQNLFAILHSFTEICLQTWLNARAHVSLWIGLIYGQAKWPFSKQTQFQLGKAHGVLGVLCAIFKFRHKPQIVMEIWQIVFPNCQSSFDFGCTNYLILPIYKSSNWRWIIAVRRYLFFFMSNDRKKLM